MSWTLSTITKDGQTIQRATRPALTGVGINEEAATLESFYLSDLNRQITLREEADEERRQSNLRGLFGPKLGAYS